MRTCVLALAGVLAATSTAPALADEPAPTPAPESRDTWIQCPRCHPAHWTGEPSRTFLSLTMDTGYLYPKRRWSRGYGRPFALWRGVYATPIITPDYTGG